MKSIIFFLLLILMNACNALPQFYQTVEDVADDTAIKIEISRETFQKETDIDIEINVRNKDE